MIRPTLQLLDGDDCVVGGPVGASVSVECTQSGAWEVLLEATVWIHGPKTAERVRVLREDGETQSVLALEVPAGLEVVDVTVHMLLSVGHSVFQELGVEW